MGPWFSWWWYNVILKGCCWTKMHRYSWPPVEKNSIWSQRRGLIAQSFCVIKYKGDRESFWHRHQKGAERVPPCLSSAGCYIVTAVKSLQSCPTLCTPIDGSPPGSAIPGILQARTLEWVAISFSNAWKWKVKVNSLSYVWLFATPWTAAYHAPPSMGFFRQEYWSGCPLAVC